MDNETSVYTIGTVAELIHEHPETLRVWERNGLISPNRNGYQRKYSNNDLKRLEFIKSLMDEKGLNIAGVRQVISMYSCWNHRFCAGGAKKNSTVPVNTSKPCWKIKDTYCLSCDDKSEYCHNCSYADNCSGCDNCGKK